MNPDLAWPLTIVGIFAVWVAITVAADIYRHRHQRQTDRIRHATFMREVRRQR